MQTRADSVQPQGDHSPVELAPEPRLIALADVRLRGSVSLRRHGLERTHVLTHRGIRYADAIVLKATPHIELAHLLLVKPGRRILPVAGYEAVNPAPHLFGHYTPDTAAAVILWFCQKIVVNLPGCGSGSRLFFELPKILAYRLAAHAVASRYLPDAHPLAAMRQNDGCLFLHV